LRHVHEFVPKGSGTLMLDTFEFASQFSVLGRLLDKLVLEGYFRRLLIARNVYVKQAAERGQLQGPPAWL
jgi:ligand-binding SRPBCC domain-containing protein